MFKTLSLNNPAPFFNVTFKTSCSHFGEQETFSSKTLQLNCVLIFKKTQKNLNASDVSYTKTLPLWLTFQRSFMRTHQSVFNTNSKTLLKRHNRKQTGIMYLKVNEICLTSSETAKRGDKENLEFVIPEMPKLPRDTSALSDSFSGIFVLIMCVFMIPVRVHSRKHPANLLARSLSARHRPRDKKVTLSFQPTRTVNPITRIRTHTRADVHAQTASEVCAMHGRSATCKLSLLW